ncbi:MAG: hypothetical protein IT359_01370 [Gemmatimonadaceae bacterium]|nr:hypothetical protein [Gemmatimonadaceae bacterium]
MLDSSKYDVDRDGAVDDESELTRRERLANGLARAASRLRDRSDRMDGRAADLAERAGNALDSAEDLVRDFDTDDIIDSVMRYARRRPGAVLLTGVAVGFLAAHSLRRRAN